MNLPLIGGAARACPDTDHMGMEYRDPNRAKKRAARRQREEKRWAAKAGPVETRRVTPEGTAPLPKSDDEAADVKGTVVPPSEAP